MKKTNRTPFLPLGISALALVAMSLPAGAQDAASATVPDAPASISIPATTPEAAPAPAKVELEAEGEDGTPAVAETLAETRTFPEVTDPYVAQDVLRLDSLGVVTRQARIGEDILVIDREIRRAQAVDQLVGYLGRDAFEKAYPDLAEDLHKSPIILRAELEKQELINKIEAAKTKKTEDGKEEDDPKPRDDGSSFFTMIPSGPASKAPAAATADGKPAPTNGPSANAETPAPSTIMEAESPEPVKEAIQDIPISLRQIFGLADDLTAVIDHGGERIRVQSGDVLPNDTVIEFIGDDYIKIKRHGESVRMQIRG